METGINYYAARKEYIKLKDIAEASDVAGKVCSCLRHHLRQHSWGVQMLQLWASQAWLWDHLWNRPSCVCKAWLHRWEGALCCKSLVLGRGLRTYHSALGVSA